MNRITAKVDTKVLVGVLVALTLVVGIAAVARLDVLGKKGGGLGKDFKYDVKEMAYIDPLHGFMDDVDILWTPEP